MPHQALLWIGFNLFVLALLALDLGVFHRTAQVVNVKEALAWSVFWTFLALLFNAGMYWYQGADVALQFFTGYVIERSLSVDNLFVFVVVFSYFDVPRAYQYKVLFWGILGALILRAAMIALGAALFSAFNWIVYVFGAFLIITAIRLAWQKESGVHPENNGVVRLFRKLMPVTGEYHDSHFFIKKKGRYWATPLFLVLLTVEFTDLVFAVDSIPAIFAVTPDPFIVYTSNVFAILGLRALYFALAGVMELFHYLKLGLALILAFVGVKMLISHYFPIPIQWSLLVIVIILLIAVGASLLFPEKNKKGFK